MFLTLFYCDGIFGCYIHLGVQVGDVGELFPSIIPQPLPREEGWRDSDMTQIEVEKRARGDGMNTHTLKSAAALSE
jgi:hypothetical protein